MVSSLCSISAAACERAARSEPMIPNPESSLHEFVSSQRKQLL